MTKHMHVCACAFASQLQFSDPTPTKATLEIQSSKNFRSFKRLLFVLVHSAALHSWGWTDRCPGVRSRTARNQRANRLVMISNETTAPFDIQCLFAFYFSEGTSSKNSASFEIRQVTPTHAWKSTLNWGFLIFERCLNVYSVIYYYFFLTEKCKNRSGKTDCHWLPVFNWIISEKYFFYLTSCYNIILDMRQ